MKKILQAVGVWVLIIPIAILNGGLRENVLVKLDHFPAQVLSGLILSACIFLMAYWLIPKIKHCTKRDYCIFGVLWCILTNLFDLTMVLKQGLPISHFFMSYDFTQGNLWIIVVLTTLFSPIVVGQRVLKERPYPPRST